MTDFTPNKPGRHALMKSPTKSVGNWSDCKERSGIFPYNREKESGSLDLTEPNFAGYISEPTRFVLWRDAVVLPQAPRTRLARFCIVLTQHEPGRRASSARKLTGTRRQTAPNGGELCVCESLEHCLLKRLALVNECSYDCSEVINIDELHLRVVHTRENQFFTNFLEAPKADLFFSTPL